MKRPYQKIDLRAFVGEFVDKGVIPKYGVPNKIIITDNIAKTSVGKLNKKQLRADFHKIALLKWYDLFDICLTK